MAISRTFGPAFVPPEQNQSESGGLAERLLGDWLSADEALAQVGLYDDVERRNANTRLHMVKQRVREFLIALPATPKEEKPTGTIFELDLYAREGLDRLVAKLESATETVSIPRQLVIGQIREIQDRLKPLIDNCTKQYGPATRATADSEANHDSPVRSAAEDVTPEGPCKVGDYDGAGSTLDVNSVEIANHFFAAGQQSTTEAHKQSFDDGYAAGKAHQILDRATDQTHQGLNLRREQDGSISVYSDHHFIGTAQNEPVSTRSDGEIPEAKSHDYPLIEQIKLIDVFELVRAAGDFAEAENDCGHVDEDTLGHYDRLIKALAPFDVAAKFAADLPSIQEGDAELRKVGREILTSAAINGPGEGMTKMVSSDLLDNLAEALATQPKSNNPQPDGRAERIEKAAGELVGSLQYNRPLVDPIGEENIGLYELDRDALNRLRSALSTEGQEADR